MLFLGNEFFNQKYVLVGIYNGRDRWDMNNCTLENIS